MQSSVPGDVLQGVHNSMTDMVKEVANEPSVGLYFVQQHVHKAVPGLLSLKSQLVEGTQEALSYTEDVKDSLTAVKTMKEVGSPVIKNMIATLNSSLQLLPTLHHPRVGGRSPAGYAHLSRAATHHGDTAFSKMQPENKSTAGVKGSMHEAPGLLSTPRGSLDALPPRSPRSSATQAMGLPPAPSNLDSTSYVSSFLNSAYQRASSVRMSMPTTFEVKEGLSLSKENNVSDSKRPLDSSTSQNPTQDSNAGQIANKSYWSVFESAMQKAGSMVGTGAIAGTGTASDSSLAPTIPQGPSATTLREYPSITSASHLRAVFDSAVSRAGSAVRREGSSPKSDLILERSVSESADGQAMRVDWLKLPRPAFRKLNRREETDTTQGSVEQLGTQGQGETEDLEKEDGDNSSKLNLEDPEVLESYAKLQVEQAAKLEAWLGDAKDDEPSPTF